MKRIHFLSYLSIALSLFCLQVTNAQKAKLKILLNNDRFQAKDTLSFIGTYTLGEKNLPPATLALVMKENNGDGIWQMRWPMIDGYTKAKLVLPSSMPTGDYTLYFAVEPRFFQINGRILYPPNIKTLNATIYSLSVGSKEFVLPVENGEFKISPLYFENSAILRLNVPIKEKIVPAISVEVLLDSAFEPAAAISKEITIGMGEDTIMKNKKIDNWIAYFDPFYQTTMLGNMSAAKKFDSIYVSNAYKNAMQSFDCLGDSELVKSVSLEAFLAKYFTGFKMDEVADIKQIPTAHARGYKFVFFVDEKPTNILDLGNLKLSDIAAIKVLSPSLSNVLPDEMEPGKIALYSKQGAFWSKDFYRHSYIINGYQPRVYQLPPSPKMFAASPYYLPYYFH